MLVGSCPKALTYIHIHTTYFISWLRIDLAGALAWPSSMIRRVPPMFPQSDSSWGLRVIYWSLAQNCQGIKNTAACCERCLNKLRNESKWKCIKRTNSTASNLLAMPCSSKPFNWFSPFGGPAKSVAAYAQQRQGTWRHPGVLEAGHTAQNVQTAAYIYINCSLPLSMLSMFRLKAFAVRTFKVLAPAGILLESRHEVPVRDRKLGPGQVLPARPVDWTGTV